MVLKIFIDESGKDDPPIFVMAGFIARAEQWVEFNDQWRAALDETPSLEAFHMTEARWSGHDSKLPKLVDIIKANVLTGIAVTVYHADYNSTLKGKVGKFIDKPYYLSYLSMMTVATLWQQEHGLNEKMDFIFDEQKDQSEFIQRNYNDALALAAPEVKERMGSRPMHLDDKDIMPLQAADILAWSIRKWGALSASNLPRDEQLKSFFDNLPLKRMHFDKEGMETMMRGINARNKEALSVTQHQFVKALRFRDSLIMRLNIMQVEASQDNSTILLQSFPAKQMKRFLLVHSCPLCDIPHLHRRVSGGCLSAMPSDQQV